MNKKFLIKHEELFAEALRDEEFKKVWDASKTQREIATKIIEERIRQELSQRDLAERAGVKQPIIARFESGIFKKPSYQPSISLLAKIAQALNLRMEITLTPLV